MDGAAHLYAVAIRVARLNAAGGTPAGASNSYVSNSLVKVTFTPEYETGDEITKKDGQGRTCVSVKQSDTLKRVTLNSVELCEEDPEASELLGGGAIIVAAGDTIGYAYPEVGVDPQPNGVSLEVWTRRYTDNSLDPTFPYARWVFPRCKLRPTGKTIGAEAMAAEWEGWSEENTGFGNGPANDYTATSWRCAQYVYETSFPTGASGYTTVVAQP